MPSQWERFKQSNIAKIVIGYSLVVWVLIQLIEAVLPTFETPLWVAQTLTFLLILGFPIALLVGWAYEKLPAQAADDGDGEEPSTPRLAHSTPKKTLVLIGVGSCAVIGLFGFYMMPFIFDGEGFDDVNISQSSTPKQTARGLRFELRIGETRLNATTGRKSDIAISPDGNLIVYKTYTNNDSSEIYIKDIRYDDADRLLTSLTTSPYSEGLKFSNDGSWIYFSDGADLKRIRVEGGVAQIIANDVNQRGISEAGNKIIYRDQITTQLSTIVSSGGGKEEIPALTAGTFTWPDALPGGTHALTTVSDNALNVGSGSIELLDLTSFEVTPLIQNAYHAEYAESGHIVFLRDSTLWAVPFDVDELAINGNEVPVVPGIETYCQRGGASYSFSDNGRLIYINGNETTEQNSSRFLQWISRSGEIESINVDRGYYGNLSMSPDESKVAMTLYEGDNSDIWVWDFEREILERRSFGNNSFGSIWSPDGSQLLYQSNGELGGIMAMSSNGSSTSNLLFETPSLVLPRSINPHNGEIILESWVSGCPELSYAATEIERLLQSLELSPACSAWSSISQDGNWIAYSSNETGRIEIFVRPFPDIDEGKWQVSRNGGNQPIWNSDKKELFFWSEAGEHMVVNYDVEEPPESERPSVIRLSNPIKLFATTSPSMIPMTQRNAWDYSPSRDSFLVMSPRDLKSTSTEAVLADQTVLKVIENWFSELESMVPADSD